jgi:hypothetical protein
MLDEIPPEVLDEWIAYRRIEPDPDERLRVIVTTGLTALCNAWGMKLTPEDLDPMLREAEAQEVTPEQAEVMMRAAYGG